MRSSFWNKIEHTSHCGKVKIKIVGQVTCLPTCSYLIATETKYDGYLQQMIRENLLRHIMESREISDQNKGVV